MQSNRRQFFMKALGLLSGALTLPLITKLMSSEALAESKKDAKKEAIKVVSENDNVPKSLKYKEVAAKAPERKDKTTFCHNCEWYKGEVNDKKHGKVAQCDLFQKGYVKSGGWCLGWAKKTS